MNDRRWKVLVVVGFVILLVWGSLHHYNYSKAEARLQAVEQQLKTVKEQAASAELDKEANQRCFQLQRGVKVSTYYWKTFDADPEDFQVREPPKLAPTKEEKKGSKNGKVPATEGTSREQDR